VEEYIRFFLGIAFILSISYFLSNNKNHINWKLVGTGILLQIIFGLSISKIPVVRSMFDSISEFFVTIISFSQEGTKFLFPEANFSGFAFGALPVVIFFSALTAMLYYIGFLQYIVKSIAWVMNRTMKLSGAESLSAAGNIFMGQTEAPLLVKPYISKMTNSELMCLMTGGMATIAGGVFAAYVTLLGGDDPVEKIRFTSFLLSASIMNAPAGIVLSKIIFPETNFKKINRNLIINKEDFGVNFIDALAKGASNGLKLALNIAAMLLSFIAIVYMLNYFLSYIGEITALNNLIQVSSSGQFDSLSLEYILGQIFRIFAWFIGVSWNETILVGSLLGQKFVLNEFIAYVDLASLKSSGLLSQKSIIISTYALCGFANFSSIAIQLGGIGTMAPERQKDLSKIGFKALLAATMATLLTANIAGVIMI